jgi:hypothetical protein
MITIILVNNVFGEDVRNEAQALLEGAGNSRSLRGVDM